MGLLGLHAYKTKVFRFEVNSVDIFPILCLFSFTMLYKMGIEMIPLLMTGELFPMNVKNTASTFSELISLLFNFASIKIFNWIKMSFGPQALYWFCCSNCFIGVLYTHFFVIETKGKTLEEIQTALKNNQPESR